MKRMRRYFARQVGPNGGNGPLSWRPTDRGVDVSKEANPFIMSAVRRRSGGQRHGAGADLCQRSRAPFRIPKAAAVAVVLLLGLAKRFIPGS
jgi:hypothetical protein